LGKKAIKEEIWKEALTQVAKVQLPSREKPFQSCAVVSSSEILLNHILVVRLMLMIKSFESI